MVEIDGFRHSDIVAFDSCFGVQVPPIRVVLVGPRKRLEPAGRDDARPRGALGGCPGLDRIYVYEGGSSEAGVLLTAGFALGSRGHHPDVISISLGICEPLLIFSTLRFDGRWTTSSPSPPEPGSRSWSPPGTRAPAPAAVDTPNGKTALPLLRGQPTLPARRS